MKLKYPFLKTDFKKEIFGKKDEKQNFKNSKN